MLGNSMLHEILCSKVKVSTKWRILPVNFNHHVNSYFVNTQLTLYVYVHVEHESSYKVQERNHHHLIATCKIQLPLNCNITVESLSHHGSTHDCH